MLRPTVLFFLFWCACARAVDFEDCGSVYTASSIDITGCSKAPCNIVAGSSLTVTSAFIAGSDSNVLYQDVYLRLNLITLPLDATPPPCTAGSETVCPVRAGDSSRYTAVVNFPEDLPPVAGDFYWKLQNNIGNTVICYKVAVRIKYNLEALEALQL